MSKRPVRTLFAVLVAAALLCTFPSGAQTDVYYSEPLRARSLIGMRVEDTDGHKIGTIRNLVLDVRTGTPRYAVIGSDGILGMRSILKLAPTEVMTAATAKRDTVAINTTRTQWKQVPVLQTSSLHFLAEPGAAEEISRCFQPASSHHTDALSVTGHETGAQTNTPKPELKLASNLIGSHVVNAQQERIGELSNLLVRFGEPRPAFAIISTGHFLHRGTQFAVPLSALAAIGTDREFSLNVDAAALQQAPSFSQQAWNSSVTNGSQQVYSYSKLED